MVSGSIFQYRKSSWPPEEYVNRATLELLDADSSALPKYAWRRKLNSHASILKEFSVTFMEAIKMVRLGIRLWSYVREEASQGRKAPIDPFTRVSCKPSASLGVPLGGMGSGSISRGFRGEFRNFQIVPGTCDTSPIMANQFSNGPSVCSDSCASLEYHVEAILKWLCCKEWKFETFVSIYYHCHLYSYCYIFIGIIMELFEDQFYVFMSYI